MSSLAGYAIHPVNGSREPIYDGFSWSCLLFGCFWFLYKGMWAWGVMSFVMALLSFGLSWFVLPFIANAQHAKFLIGKGYLTEGQAHERGLATSQVASSMVAPSPPTVLVADELGKLASLRDKGLLTEQEFETQKARLLGTP